MLRPIVQGLQRACQPCSSPAYRPSALRSISVCCHSKPCTIIHHQRHQNIITTYAVWYPLIVSCFLYLSPRHAAFDLSNETWMCECTWVQATAWAVCSAHACMPAPAPLRCFASLFARALVCSCAKLCPDCALAVFCRLQLRPHLQPRAHSRPSSVIASHHHSTAGS